MLRLKTLSFLSVLFFASSIWAAEPAPLENIPMQWRPTTSFAKLGVIDLTQLDKSKIRFKLLTDSRKEIALIGENTEKPAALRVTTKDNVAEFVTQQIKTLFDKAGLTLVDSGETVVIEGELKEFFVAETGLYRGQAMLKVKVTTPAGKVLWTGVVSGESKRFGRSYKAENYFEALSDSVVELTFNLLQTPAFIKSLAK